MKTKGWMAAFTVLAACAGGEAPDTNEANEMRVEAAPGERHGGPRHRMDHGRRMLEHALAQVEMTDAQRARIDAALAPSDAGDWGAHHEAMREKHEAIVVAVRSGSEADLQAATQAIRPPGEHREKFTKALNEIHATLDAEQRAALVAAIRAERDERGEHRGGRGRHRHGGFRGGEGRHERMLESLDLTDEQRSRLDAARAQAGLGRPSPEDREAHHDAMKAHMDQMLEAFVQDDFDATRIAPPEPAGGRMARHLEELRVLVPILTPEQRATLADRMEHRFEAGPRGHDGPEDEEEDAR